MIALACRRVELACQADLFASGRRAACPRHDFGFCAGPCAGLVTQADNRQRVETAVAFLEGRTIQPIDRVVTEAPTFVYRDPGILGDDRAYLIRHGLVRASYPRPGTPIEHEASRGIVAAELADSPPAAGPLPFQYLGEIPLVMAWSRRHPEAFRRTTSLESWAAQEDIL